MRSDAFSFLSSALLVLSCGSSPAFLTHRRARNAGMRFYEILLFIAARTSLASSSSSCVVSTMGLVMGVTTESGMERSSANLLALRIEKLKLQTRAMRSLPRILSVPFSAKCGVK